jgi:hypothetical protein
VSWFSPRSKSHQSGINLPLKSFKQMFSEIYENKLVNAPRIKLSICWHLPNGLIVEESSSEVIMYHSKNELRLVGIPKNSIHHYIDVDSYLLFNRNNSNITITILADGFEHLFQQLGLGNLLGKLPPQRD